jgi:hypothetical protein
MLNNVEAPQYMLEKNRLLILLHTHIIYTHITECQICGNICAVYKEICILCMSQ